MKIKWYNHVSEEELRQSTGQQSVVEKIKIARWKWFGHALRMPNDRIHKQPLKSWRPEGRRRVGRPKDSLAPHSLAGNQSEEHTRRRHEAKSGGQCGMEKFCR